MFTKAPLKHVLRTAGAIAFASTVGIGQASAAVILYASIDGGATFNPLALNADSTGGVCYDSVAPACGGFGPVGGFDISFTFGFSNNPGTESFSFTSNTSTQISYDAAIGGAPVGLLTLALVVQDFTLPDAGKDVVLASTLNGNMVFQGGDGTAVAFESFVDFSNGGLTADLSSGLLGPLDLDGFGNSTSWGPLQNSVVGSIDATPFAITSFTTVSLADGEIVNYNATASLTTVPEPMVLTLLGMGLVGLGLRRNARA